MIKIKFLSYPYRRITPVFGDPENEIICRPVKSIKSGDSANVSEFKLQNHWGTHVDCPAHFFQEGKRALEYEPGKFFFFKPATINVTPEPGEIIDIESFVDRVPDGSDIVLVQTGWCKRRNSPEYCVHNPGISPDVARYLRVERPSVRAIGMDLISISSYVKRDIGRAAHKEFLNPLGNGHEILLIEDMDLSCDLSALQRVIVAPLLVEGVDSAPCAVYGEFEN